MLLNKTAKNHKNKTGFSFFLVVKVTVLKQQMSKFYAQILSTEANCRRMLCVDIISFTVFVVAIFQYLKLRPTQNWLISTQNLAALGV